MRDLDRRYSVNERDVIAEIIEGEVLIINLKSGAYYSSNGSGQDIWRGIAQGRSAREVAAGLSADYGIEAAVAEEAVGSFIEQLEAEELVAASTASALGLAAGEKPERTDAVYAAPVLHKYTDLQEMLLLDPIHEVDPAAGWPAPKPQA